MTLTALRANKSATTNKTHYHTPTQCENACSNFEISTVEAVLVPTFVPVRRLATFVSAIRGQRRNDLSQATIFPPSLQHSSICSTLLCLSSVSLQSSLLPRPTVCIASLSLSLLALHPPTAKFFLRFPLPFLKSSTPPPHTHAASQCRHQACNPPRVHSTQPHS